MDSKHKKEAEDAKPGSGPSHGHKKSSAKRAGPAPPAPPSPLPPMKLPEPPGQSGPAGGPAGDAGVAMAQSLASKVVDDGDVIEKEWVNKARQIVEAYRNDPYKQSEELTILRANYMQRRYDKTIKLSK
ncbi:MAG: hypothetical protein ACREJM_01620 [Candidatus Saccharimonadales bacterium]